jgi:P4 family phage/plasmid primase-like protien
MRAADQSAARAKAAEAVRKAQALLDASRPASTDHPYVVPKQITPPASLREISQADAERILAYPPKSDGEPLQGRLLVVPVCINSVLSTVELIDEHGRKSAIAGGRKGGGYWSTVDLPDCDWSDDLTVITGEGMATVVSASMATGHIGVAALCCGNLLPVGKAMRERYPDAKIVFAADLGIGVTKSTEAARAVDGYVAIPKFAEGVEGKDANDLHVASGLEAVRQCIEAATKPAPAEPAAEAIDAELLPAREYGFSESEVARRFGDQIRDRARFAADEGVWYYHDGKRWVKDHGGVWMLEQSLKVSLAYAQDGIRLGSADPQFQFYMATAKTYNGLPGRKRLIELVRAEPELAILSSRFDADPWLLNVDNGTLDLRTGKLRPHCSSDLISKIAPVGYDLKATAPLWERCLPQWLADEETIAFLQRFIGDCMSGSVEEHVVVFCHGVGANGKTVLWETIKRLLGDYAVLAPTSLLMAKQQEPHPCDRMVLKGARLALFTETPSGQRFDEATMKATSGGDSITGRGMRENFSTFPPTHKVVICGNHKPIVRGQDEGIWRRLRLVPFEKVIPESDRDPKLAEKLRAELPGVLNWAIAGCLAWRRDGLGISAKVREASAGYRQESDILGPFIVECCELDSGTVAARAAIYRAYVTWSEAQGERRAMSEREVAELLRGRGFGECWTRLSGKRCRGWQGLRLNTGNTGNTSTPDFRLSPYENSLGRQAGNQAECVAPVADGPASAAPSGGETGPSAAGVLGNCTRVRAGTTVTPADVETLAASAEFRFPLRARPGWGGNSSPSINQKDERTRHMENQHLPLTPGERTLREQMSTARNLSPAMDLAGVRAAVAHSQADHEWLNERREVFRRAGVDPQMSGGDLILTCLICQADWTVPARGTDGTLKMPDDEQLLCPARPREKACNRRYVFSNE